VAAVLLASGMVAVAVRVVFSGLLINLCRGHTPSLSEQVVQEAAVEGTVAHEVQAVLTLSLAH
jgi:hypothetical protein